MDRRSLLLIALCCGVLLFLAGPPSSAHVVSSAVPMSAFDAGHHLQDQHHSGKLHRFGPRRASETVPPPVVLPSLVSANVPEEANASGDTDSRPLRSEPLANLTPRSPPAFH